MPPLSSVFCPVYSFTIYPVMFVDRRPCTCARKHPILMAFLSDKRSHFSSARLAAILRLLAGDHFIRWEFFPAALWRGSVGVIKPSDCGAASSFALSQSAGLLKVRLGGSFMFLQYEICAAITYQVTEARLRCCHRSSWPLRPADGGFSSLVRRHQRHRGLFFTLFFA